MYQLRVTIFWGNSHLLLARLLLLLARGGAVRPIPPCPKTVVPSFAPAVYLNSEDPIILAGTHLQIAGLQKPI
jgi:hypothetical protein